MTFEVLVTERAEPEDLYGLSTNHQDETSQGQTFVALTPRLSVLLRAADRDIHAQRIGHGRFGQHGLVRLLRTLRVGHLDVVALVTSHHLVARDAVGHRVHDRPLRRCGFPASLCLAIGELDNFGAA